MFRVLFWFFGRFIHVEFFLSSTAGGCCPMGWTVFESNCYFFSVKESRSWSEAQSYCRTYHTDLTSIRSKEEKSNITLTLNGSGVQYVWIGLYRDPWAFWSDNTTSTFTNWMSGQPDNYGSLEYEFIAQPSSVSNNGGSYLVLILLLLFFLGHKINV
uniref:C-type lectin domain family 10 member A n=1 Tax=Maylandia zebra TaxID=106582 RepID=A0A3P9DTC3_9CICH